MKYIKRIQGTDGIRGKITLNNEAHPIYHFLFKGEVSPEFFKIYAYSYCAFLAHKNLAANRLIVICSDNRDPGGEFLKHACEGCQLAGFDVYDVGILPTGAAPISAKNNNADAAIMLTASHNSAEYHGIKLFSGITGLKLSIEEEIELTSYIYYIANQPLPDMLISSLARIHDQALAHYLSTFNSLISRLNISSHMFHIVLDCAKGASSSMASKVFKQLGKCKIDVVNNDLAGPINTNGGAAFFEGIDQITRKEYKEDKRFEEIEILKTIFGKIAKSEKIRQGKILLMGFAFDGDADRCLPMVYNPFADAVTVFNGDKTVALIISAMTKTSEKNIKLFHTIECDTNIRNLIPKSSPAPEMHAVGDRFLSIGMKAHNDKTPDQDVLIGYESSGHVVFPVKSPSTKTIMVGDGIRTALEFIAAINSCFLHFDVSKNIKSLTSPYDEGVMETSYIYYTDKNLLDSDDSFKMLFRNKYFDISTKLKKKGFSIGGHYFKDEPNLIFYEITLGKYNGYVFIRQSGTEEKTSVNIRGSKELEDCLVKVKNDILVFLLCFMKKKDRKENILCAELINIIKKGKTAPLEKLMKSESTLIMLDIMQYKERLIEKNDGKYALTALGYTYYEFLSSSTEFNAEAASA